METQRLVTGCFDVFQQPEEEEEEEVWAEEEGEEARAPTGRHLSSQRLPTAFVFQTAPICKLTTFFCLSVFPSLSIPQFPSPPPPHPIFIRKNPRICDGLPLRGSIVGR